MNHKKFYFDFPVMRQTMTHLYQKQFSSLLRQYGLSQMEADILLFLANNPQYDTATEIVTVRRLTKSHVSSSIESLVQKHFLERCYEDGNKKVIHLKLLQDAGPVAAAGRKCQQDFFSLLIRDIPGEELETAKKVLEKILENAKRSVNESEE